MNVSFFIARRYFLSRRKKNFIHVISWLSAAGVAFGTAALIVVLSVFNGLEILIGSFYTSFDPELKVEARLGKSFPVSDSLLTALGNTEGVAVVTEVIEDYVYVRYNGADMVVTAKGVSENFLDQHRLDGQLAEGRLVLREDSVNYAIVGRGVQYTLSMAIEETFYPLQLYYIRKGAGFSFDPTQQYTTAMVMPGGVFSIEKNYDENYILLPLAVVRDLMDYGNQRTALEIKSTPSTKSEDVKARIQQILGDGFTVKSNFEQHKDLYRLLKMEKLFMFLALGLLITIVSVNIFFSLMMLVIDKTKDISVLASLGATPRLVSSVFVTEGMVIAGIGAGCGLVLGGVLCWLQETVGLVSMGMENAVVPNYPVKMLGTDFLAVLGLIAVITITMSWYPAQRAARAASPQHL
ncbi:MAG: ABC transporter permease [Cyclobacteriaceae bacterium]